MQPGVLTGGGDGLGLNALILAAIWREVEEFGHEFVGVKHGWGE
jgi:ATP-dependent phosphofructokinase / diphosphate-dependent phosphofructokinase